MPVSGGSATISGLMPSTTYSIQVAAVNSVGPGVYSDEMIQQTAGEHILHEQCQLSTHQFSFIWCKIG